MISSDPLSCKFHYKSLYTICNTNVSSFKLLPVLLITGGAFETKGIPDYVKDLKLVSDNSAKLELFITEERDTQTIWSDRKFQSKYSLGCNFCCFKKQYNAVLRAVVYFTTN